MTGHGDARLEEDGLRVAAEVRTVNNRYLKLTLRGDPLVTSLESKVEAVVRQTIRRGHVHLAVAVQRDSAARAAVIDAEVLAHYVDQTNKLAQRLHVTQPSLDALLQLPGVICEPSRMRDEIDSEWPNIEQTIRAAMSKLHEMRLQEGAAMLDDLQANCQAITRELAAIEARGPQVIDAYRERLTDKINRWLEKSDFDTIQSSDVIREVGIFSERSDISEETVRMRSHIGQFQQICRAPESSGRKLEFVIQEMFRETNTIGSKANDAEISAHVVEIKTRIERMREMVQNVE
jgi:uncharacterized protein (TIGR00255 family)